MRFIGYMYLRYLLFLFFLFLGMPLILGFGLIWRFFTAKYKALEAFDLLVAIPILLWLLGTFWIGREVSDKIAFEHMSFGKAVKTTYDDARLLLGFVPFIGHWFSHGRR